MKENRFDKYSASYDEVHSASLGIAGRKKEYYAAQKIEMLAKLLRAGSSASACGLFNGHGSGAAHVRQANIRRILEFGCGVGNNLPHLIRLFPGAEVLGCDVSSLSLDEAATKNPQVKLYHVVDAEGFSAESLHGLDLILAANVFHHIDCCERKKWMEILSSVLRPGGILALIEHNPINPLTRYMVRQCPFDEGVSLLTLAEAKALARRARLEIRCARYTYPVPVWPSGARLAGRVFGWLPLGFQYCLLAEAKQH